MLFNPGRLRHVGCSASSHLRKRFRVKLVWFSSKKPPQKTALQHSTRQDSFIVHQLFPAVSVGFAWFFDSELPTALLVPQVFKNVASFIHDRSERRKFGVQRWTSCARRVVIYKPRTTVFSINTHILNIGLTLCQKNWFVCFQTNLCARMHPKPPNYRMGALKIKQCATSTQSSMRSAKASWWGQDC